MTMMTMMAMTMTMMMMMMTTDKPHLIFQLDPTYVVAYAAALLTLKTDEKGFYGTVDGEERFS